MKSCRILIYNLWCYASCEEMIKNSLDKVGLNGTKLEKKNDHLADFSFIKVFNDMIFKSCLMSPDPKLLILLMIIIILITNKLQ